MFDRLAYIDALLVDGKVNGEDMQDFVRHVVFHASDEKLATNITFTNLVRTNLRSSATVL